MHKTNPDLIRSCPCFRGFRLNFASDCFKLLLIKVIYFIFISRLAKTMHANTSESISAHTLPV